MNFVHDFSIEETCLAPIDVQGMFCNPRHFSLNKWKQPWIATERTRQTAKRISTVACEFNALACDVAWIYYTDPYMKKSFKFAGKFYQVIPRAKDSIIPKYEDSAFEGGDPPYVDDPSPFQNWISSRGKKHIVLCGFQLSACVFKTTFDAALRGYKVTVLADISVDGRPRGKVEQEHSKCLHNFSEAVFKLPKQVSSNIRFGRSADVLNIYQARTLSVA